MQLVFHRHSLILCSVSICFGVIPTLRLFHLQFNNHYPWMENKIDITRRWIITTITLRWGIRSLRMTIPLTIPMLTFTLQQHLIMTIGKQNIICNIKNLNYANKYWERDKIFIFDIRLYSFFSPSGDGGNFQENICINGDEHHNDDDPEMLMVGGNRNDGSAIFGFDHVEEFCVRYFSCKKNILIHPRIDRHITQV